MYHYNCRRCGNYTVDGRCNYCDPIPYAITDVRKRGESYGIWAARNVVAVLLAVFCMLLSISLAKADDRSYGRKTGTSIEEIRPGVLVCIDEYSDKLTGDGQPYKKRLIVPSDWYDFSSANNAYARGRCNVGDKNSNSKASSGSIRASGVTMPSAHTPSTASYHYMPQHNPNY